MGLGTKGPSVTRVTKVSENKTENESFYSSFPAFDELTKEINA